MDDLDRAMADGLLDTVRRAALQLYGETQTYPCDDVKRMASDIARLTDDLEHWKGNAILAQRFADRDRAEVARLTAERDALRAAVAIVRQNMNTQINGGMGWMADFESVVGTANNSTTRDETAL